jgi:hypothetical protein
MMTLISHLLRHVRQPRERSVISHDARKAHLILTFVHAERQRILDRPLDHLHGPPFCPVRLFAEIGMDQLEIQPLSIGADCESVFVPLVGCIHAKGGSSGPLILYV